MPNSHNSPDPNRLHPHVVEQDGRLDTKRGALLSKTQARILHIEIKYGLQALHFRPGKPCDIVPVPGGLAKLMTYPNRLEVCDKLAELQELEKKEMIEGTGVVCDGTEPTEAEI